MKRKATESRTRKAARIAHRIVRFIIDIDPWDAFYRYQEEPEEFLYCTIDCVLNDSETAKSDTLDWIETLETDSKFHAWAESILEDLNTLETMTV